MQHPKQEAFLNATPAGRLRLLADEIVEDRSHHFDMGHSDFCAYAFARRIVGEEKYEPDHVVHFASILGVPHRVAHAIYTCLGGRKETANRLQIIAEKEPC